jgi:hypothetical protein
MAALPQFVETSQETLTDALAPLAVRMRVSRWVRYASRGALAGMGVSLIGVILAHFDILPDSVPLEALIPIAIGVGVAGGTLPALLKPVTPMDAARLTETRLGLKERLSSALEFEDEAARGGRATVILRLQHGDALGHIRTLSPREAVPFRFVWELKALLAGAAILTLALILPNLPVFIPPQLRIERSIVHKEGDKLVARARTVEKFADAHRLSQTKRAAQDMRRLGEQMTHGRMDKKQALLKYSQLTQQMQALQKKLSDAAAGGQANKSLSQAGQQLAQSLQAAGAGGKSGDNPTTGNPASANKTGSAGQPASPGKAGDKSGQKSGDHGFNIPGFNKAHQNPSGASNPGGKPGATEEVRKAAEAMRRGDVGGLSDQLRKLADKTQSGALSPDQQQQAQQDLQKLADALKGTPMKETQQHAQAAADALKRGDKQEAAKEMRKAADAAEREQQQMMDAQGMDKAQQSLQRSQEEMAGASSPGDISNGSEDSGQDGQDSGQGDSSGNGSGSQDEQSADQRMHSGSGEGKGQGNQPGDEPGEEGGGAGAANRAGHGGNRGSGKIGKQKFSKFQGPAPHVLNPNFDPSRSPRYAKVYLGKPGQGKEAGRLGKAVKMRPGAAPPGGAQSNVPYYNYVGDAKKAAEKSVDSESIPPAYRDQVRKYFNSITPDGK